MDPSAAVLDMPKKPSRKKPGPKPVGGGRTANTPVRSTEAWKEWVVKFTDWDRAPSMADLIDRALVSYARERGFPEPAPKR